MSTPREPRVAARHPGQVCKELADVFAKKVLPLLVGNQVDFARPVKRK